MTTPLTLRVLVAVAGLRLGVDVGGPSLEREVRWVHATELPEPGPYLRADALVCTVGLSLTSVGACRSFASAVAAAGCAGICFGTGDVHDSIPHALLEACRTHGLALLDLPPGVPFHAVAEHVEQWRTTAADRDVARVREVEQVGQLMALVAEGLADPRALQPALGRAGLAEAVTLTVSAWPAGSVTRLLEHLPTAVLGDTGTLVFAVTATPQSARAAAESARLPCGLSGEVPARSLSRALADSRAALDLTHRGRRVVGAEELATFEGLMEQLPAAVLAPFVDQVVRPLLESDARHGTSQVETLRVFLSNDGSLQRTASEQFLHVNTVRHRLQRVHEITHRNPLRFADRVALAVALWAADHPERP